MRGGPGMQPPLMWDATEVRAALDRPAAEYLAYAARPGVAAALAQFKSERDVHQTDRLDLVTWVQYICAFGVAGPSEDAWTQLFHACRFPNEGAVAQGLSSDSPLTTGDFLREHEIAVLLAHAKVAPDLSDAMTHAALVKHRIRPAVFGRNDARTPGIIRHVSAKFEDWIFGYMTKWMCHYIVQEFSPAAFLPGFPDFSVLGSPVAGLKHCADAHAAKNVKDWGDVVMHLLEIDHNTTSPRAARFEEKAQETRALLYVRFYAKISEHCLASMQPAGLMASDPATVVHSAIKSEATAHAHYRSAAAVLSPTHVRSPDALAASAGVSSKDRITAGAYAVIRGLCGLRSPPRPPTAGRIVRAVARVMALHAPKYAGEASLSFVPSGSIRAGRVSHGRSHASGTGDAHVRLANFGAPDRAHRLPAAPRARICRALELELRVAVCPPSKGSRPVLRVLDFESARWVPLANCGCERLEPVSELGVEADEARDPAGLSVERDAADGWLGELTPALAGARAVEWTTEHACDGIRKLPYAVSVPARVADAARAEAGMGPRSPNAGPTDVETFAEHLWIDCNTGAKAEYAAAAGTELAPKAPSQRWMLERLPCWRWRAT